MEINKLDELDDLLRVLRANGITVFKSGTIEVVLGSVVAGAEPPSPDVEAPTRDDRFGDGRAPTFSGE